MKLVILAGGYGTRLSEETVFKPKPMIEIGAKPILWHIMKIYSKHGINDFIICSGYKSSIIKEYFEYESINSKDLKGKNNTNFILNQKNSENWKVTLLDTGEHTMTGGRLKKAKKYLKNEEDFCFTYGDGLSDVNITRLISFHKRNKREATLTAVQPPGRYGILKLGKKNRVNSFREKPQGDGSWINGGFFVLNTKVISRIAGNSTMWEKEPLEGLARDKQLLAYKHKGFWHPMDTLRDKKYLEKMWKSGKAPWKIW